MQLLNRTGLLYTLLTGKLLLSSTSYAASSDGDRPPVLVAHSSNAQSTAAPNIVFILTDDQDLHLNSLNYMPYLQRHLVGQGTSYQRHYCTIAICCPSRVSLWTGKAAHNTNVTDVSPPYGNY
jgi:N-acetylglucosamine-6-sulfatase